MRMMKRSKKPYMPRTSLTQSGWMTRPPSPSVRNLRPSRPKSRLIFEQCRTSGGGTKQLKSNTTLTLTTPRNFSAHWKLFLAPLPRAAPHYCRQMGRCSSRTRRVSANAGGSTSALCWIGTRQLTQTPWIRSPNSPYEFRSLNPLLSRRSRRRATGRASGKDGILAEIYKAAGPNALGAFHDVWLTVLEE